MATIKEQLEEDIRNTMRARNRERLETLRFLKSQIQLTEKNNLKELDESGVTDVVAKQVKDRRESIEMFGQGGRADLVAKEEASLAILLEYMPEQLGEGEIEAIARQAIADAGAAGPGDRGKVMGRIMPQVRGKADGSQVNAIVSRLLESAG
ncbi:MAG: GatB/YqeY domain-containing protein [Chloroflexota bacterium]|nr:GatB/YqeY domain-containing protein [Chloroflexota bacterium]MDE2959419.1 GatB/YqeY domain-containing protein [Chloroflexota bacterium]